MEYITIIQNPIKTARKNLGLTQEEFAEELGVMLNRNLTKKDICRWEQCEHRPGREVLIAIAKMSKQDIVKFITETRKHFDRTEEMIGRRRKYATNNQF